MIEKHDRGPTVESGQDAPGGSTHVEGHVTGGSSVTRMVRGAAHHSTSEDVSRSFRKPVLEGGGDATQPRQRDGTVKYSVGSWMSGTLSPSLESKHDSEQWFSYSQLLGELLGHAWYPRPSPQDVNSALLNSLSRIRELEAAGILTHAETATLIKSVLSRYVASTIDINLIDYLGRDYRFSY